MMAGTECVLTLTLSRSDELYNYRYRVRTYVSSVPLDGYRSIKRAFVVFKVIFTRRKQASTLWIWNTNVRRGAATAAAAAVAPSGIIKARAMHTGAGTRQLLRCERIREMDHAVSQ